MAESWPNYPESFYTGPNSKSSTSWSEGVVIEVVEGGVLNNINFKATFQADSSFDYGGDSKITVL